MVGYSAIPLVAQGCNDSSCKGQSTNITYTYAFPDWFISRVVYFNFKNEQLRGPELCLRVVRVRPYTSEVFLAVADNRDENAILQTKRLLLAGEASVLDVDPGGETLLSMVIRWGRFDVIDFLINAGSDIFYEDNTGVSPCTLAWQHLLDPKWGEEGNRRLRHHFHDDSQLVTLNLPDLTQAFLNKSGKDFYNVLASTPRSAIDDTDSGGRTILAWAAHQGDEDAVKALLACGADPNHKDRAGLTPLHMSTYASTPECLRLLLSAKADVDIRDNLGDTALHLAVRGGDETDCSEILLAHGADIECKAQFDWTPLRLAAKYNRPRQLSLLLSKGANINASESDGTAALYFAIKYKSSAVVRILLDNPRIDYERKLDNGFTIIHLAAQYTDFETLKILEATDLSKIDLAAVSAKEITALDIARWRRDKNEDWANWSLEPCDEDPEAWYEAFKELMNSILMSQGKDILGDSESECSTCPTESSVGDDPEGSEDQHDENDEWYDTAEEGD